MLFNHLKFSSSFGLLRPALNAVTKPTKLAALQHVPLAPAAMRPIQPAGRQHSLRRFVCAFSTKAPAATAAIPSVQKTFASTLGTSLPLRFVAPSVVLASASIPVVSRKLICEDVYSCSIKNPGLRALDIEGNYNYLVEQPKQWSFLAQCLGMAWFGLVTAVIASIGFVVQVITYIVTAPFDPARYYSGRVFRFTCSLPFRFQPLWDFKLLGECPEEPSNTMIVANHLSSGDAFALSALLPWEMKFIAKDEVGNYPILGWMMRLSGDILVSYKKKKGSSTGWKVTNRQAILDKTADMIKKGANVFIFPEGWRSPTARQDGAFSLAIENGTDMLPIAIVGTNQFWYCDETFPRNGRAYVKVGKPISTKGMTLDDMEDLKKRVQREIIQLKKEIIEEVGGTQEPPKYE